MPGLDAENIDTINGHLTATSKDPLEIENWTKALNRNGKDFPYINSLKSMVGTLFVSLRVCRKCSDRTSAKKPIYFSQFKL